ncbi:hypothetical protein [Halorussus sp. MSC15.2]|uniref:hypothetical protein n=1 Tax=Halorussus sp. MSC15.2 TaxID=2283638 RepID=UPI0013D1FBB8|nr:hypothetical protein [Halorussus sp. MSC15.2]NEU57714.1 hypothetical protein [Halorussus sp. MSC15.2]
MDEQLDRRGFLRRAGAASFGVAGLAGGVAAQEGGGVQYFRMVVPRVDLLEADFANRVVLVSEPNQPGFRPPDACFPEVPESADDQWISYDATVIDPTETEGFFGGDPNSIGGFEDTAAFVGDPVPPRSLYRVVGGEPCGGGDFYRLQTHELVPGLANFLDVAVERLDGDEEDGGGGGA